MAGTDRRSLALALVATSAVFVGEEALAQRPGAAAGKVMRVINLLPA